MVMWISKDCLLPAWVLASVVAVDAFIPVIGSHHRSKSIVSKTPLSTKAAYRYYQNNVSTKTMTSLKSVESRREDDSCDDELPPLSTSLEEIPRGGGTSVLKDKPPALPTFADYRKFAVPCLALWVAQPLLSLVDTSFVGLSAGLESASQLASLGPATTFFDGATYLFAFLNVATTNLYSSARAQRGEASDEAEAVVCTASRVALRCGIGIMLFLWAFARPLLALYIGHGPDDVPALLDSAVAYVKIRAFSLPTSLLLGVVQSALLGAKDSVTPLIAILYSTIVNVVGDFFLVKIFGMGLRGAAIATLLAQLAATAALLGPARKRLVRDGSLRLWKKKKITTANGDENVVGGKAFLGFAAPVLTLILGKLAAFGFMTHSAAAVPGQPTSLACHQIILSLFFFVSPFMEVISQTAQTFIPPYLAPVMEYVTENKISKPTNDPLVKPWLDTAFSVGNSLMKLGFIVAIAVASLASLIPAFFGGILTSDTVVTNTVKPLAKYLWIGAFLTAPVAVSEGILLARRELKFLAGVYLLTTCLLPPALLRVKSVGGVEQVWACFAVFQLCRAGFFATRIWSGSIINAITNLFGRKRSTEAMKESAAM